MRFASKLVLPVLMLSLPSAASAAGNRDGVVIERFIAERAARTGGEGSENARMTGDLNRDGVPDVAVLYAIEGGNGGNNYGQHLAVFLRRKGRLVPTAAAVVGGKWYRSITLTSIRNNVIFAKTLAYAGDDSSATPHVKAATRFVLAGRTIREQKAAPESTAASSKMPPKTARDRMPRAGVTTRTAKPM